MYQFETKYFNPIKFGFKWTEDGWYEWNSEAAHKAAKEARDKAAKDLKQEGCRVRIGSSSNQLVKVGGIGTGHPEIEHIVTVYKLTVL